MLHDTEFITNRNNTHTVLFPIVTIGKKSEKIAPEIMSTDSENESSYACKEKEMLLSKTGKVRKCAAYSEVKHQRSEK